MPLTTLNLFRYSAATAAYRRRYRPEASGQKWPQAASPTSRFNAISAPAELPITPEGRTSESPRSRSATATRPVFSLQSPSRARPIHWHPPAAATTPKADRERNGSRHNEDPVIPEELAIRHRRRSSLADAGNHGDADQEQDAAAGDRQTRPGRAHDSPRSCIASRTYLPPRRSAIGATNMIDNSLRANTMRWRLPGNDLSRQSNNGMLPNGSGIKKQQYGRPKDHPAERSCTRPRHSRPAADSSCTQASA